jgi:hypothetical protein
MGSKGLIVQEDMRQLLGLMICRGCMTNADTLPGVEKLVITDLADELKDSPANRTGPLYQQKVYVDVNRALANAGAGKSTLIARDSLENYQGQQQRTVAERSTTGGTVTIQSQGLTVLQSGSSIDLSGGSVQYDAAKVRTSVVVSGGVQTDLTDARADIPYDTISTRFVLDYGRWNRKEVIDLGQSFRFDPGYVDGKDAGQLSLIGLQGTVMQADVLGRTTTGALQREAGSQPLGARLVIGTGAVAGPPCNEADGTGCFLLVRIASATAALNN